MLQFLRKILVVISGLVILLFSIEGFLIALTIETNKWIREQVDLLAAYLFTDQTMRLVTLIASGVFLLTCLSTLFSLIKFRRRERTINLRSPYGEVRVSLGAIEDFIKMTKEQIRGIKEIRPKVFARKAGLKIYLKVALWSDQNIHEMTQEIQDTIRRYMQDTLGIEEIASIRVFVGKIHYREPEKSHSTSSVRGIEYTEL